MKLTTNSSQNLRIYTEEDMSDISYLDVIEKGIIVPLWYLQRTGQELSIEYDRERMPNRPIEVADQEIAYAARQAAIKDDRYYNMSDYKILQKLLEKFLKKKGVKASYTDQVDKIGNLVERYIINGAEISKITIVISAIQELLDNYENDNEEVEKLVIRISRRFDKILSKRPKALKSLVRAQRRSFNKYNKYKDDPPPMPDYEGDLKIIIKESEKLGRNKFYPKLLDYIRDNADHSLDPDDDEFLNLDTF